LEEHVRKRWYTWDVAALQSYVQIPTRKHKLSPKRKDYLRGGTPPARGEPDPIEYVQERLLKEERTRGEKGPSETLLTITYTLTSKGRAFLDRYYQRMNFKFPVDLVRGWYAYDTAKGRILIYDLGVDMFREWPVMFGRTTPMGTNPYKLPEDYRPWLPEKCGVLTPNIFYDTNREDYALTDAYGGPHLGDSDAQAKLTWLYAAGSDKTRKELFDLFCNTVQAAFPEVNLNRFLSAWEVEAPPLYASEADALDKKAEEEFLRLKDYRVRGPNPCGEILAGPAKICRGFGAVIPDEE
jgi:hypothetical protein